MMNRLFLMLGIVGTLAVSSPALAQDAGGETSDPEPQPATEPAEEVVEAAPLADDPEPQPAIDASSSPEDAEPDAPTATEPPTEPPTDSLPEPALEQPVVTTPSTETTPTEPAPADPEPQPSEAAPRPSGPALTFANSFFSWTNAITANTLAPGGQLTYNPTYVQSFSVTPRFYLTNTTFLWLNQAAQIELTDADNATYNREFLLADTLLDLRQLVAWEGFVMQAQARLAFPTSKLSQAANRIIQTGLGVTVARPIPEALGLTIAGTFGYRRWWATTNVPTTDIPDEPDPRAAQLPPSVCAQTPAGEAPFCDQASGLTSGRDILLGGLTLNIAPLPGLTVSLSGFLLGIYGHEIGEGNVAINGGRAGLSDDSPTRWRAGTFMALAVAYDVLPWLNLQLGIQNSGIVAPLFNQDGSVRSPFNPDTQIFLTTTVGLDSLFGEIVGGDEDDGLTPEERQRRRQGLASTGGRSAF